MVKWIITILFVFLSITACGKVLEDISASDKGPYDMDWFYKHNGYAIMTVMDIDKQPVMEIVAIPLNSEAMLALVREDVSDILYYFKKRIGHQRPVFYLTAYAYRDCCFSWPDFMLQQGQSRVYPANVLSLEVPEGSSEYGSARELIAAASRLFAKYGERRVREADHMVGLFTDIYTGRDVLKLDAEIELMPSERLSAVAVFGGGLRLDQPFRLVCRARKFILSNGKVYTTHEVSRPVKIYTLEGQELPGENIHKYRSPDELEKGRKRDRLRERDMKEQQ